jgi:hypothetical protein
LHLRSGLAGQSHFGKKTQTPAQLAKHNSYVAAARSPTDAHVHGGKGTASEPAEKSSFVSGHVSYQGIALAMPKVFRKQTPL